MNDSVDPNPVNGGFLGNPVNNPLQPRDGHSHGVTQGHVAPLTAGKELGSKIKRLLCLLLPAQKNTIQPLPQTTLVMEAGEYYVQASPPTSSGTA